MVATSLNKAAWLLAATATLACAATTHAHAGPQVRGIYPNPTSNVLLSNRGLLFGTPGSPEWSLLCNEALGVGTAEVPKVVVLPDARIIAASSRGVTQTANGGCHWESVAPFDTVNAPSLTQDPEDPQRLYLSTYAPGMSAVHTSEDGGLTWRRLSTAADSDYLGCILVAPNHPDRLYLRAISVGTTSLTYATWRSADGGETWEQSHVTLAENESDLLLLAVSPRDPQLVVAKGEAGNPMATPERLLVSHDGGETFDNPISLQVINAAVFNADGATLTVGSDDGLFVSTDSGETFTKVGDAAYIDSLNFDRGELMVGGYFRGVEAGLHGVGISSDGGATWTPWMLLNQVVQPLACEASATSATQCEHQWPDWEREILGMGDDPSAAGTGGTTPETRMAGAAGRSSDAGASGAALGGDGARTAGPPASGIEHAASCSLETSTRAAPGSRHRGFVAGLAGVCLLSLRRSQRSRRRRRVR